MAKELDFYNRQVGRHSRVPNIGISTPAGGFTPAGFEAMVYTPQKEDMSLLQRSLATLDERKEKTDQQRAAIRSAIGKMELNAAEDEWKNNYTNDIVSKINSAAQFGDYSAALETATDLAGKAVSDPALIGRMRANEEYKQEVKTQQERRNRGEISQNTYNWWMANNPYKYEDKYDKDGNIIGGSTYEPEFRPVADINWASAAMAAFKMVTPYKSSTSTDGSSSVANHTSGTITRGGKTYKPGESIGGSSHSSQSQEKVTKQQIVARMEELLKATPDGYRQAEQAFDVSAYEFKNMVEKYNELVQKDPNSQEAKDLANKIDVRKQLMYRNGSMIDYKEYYARMVTDSLFAEGLAYDWRTSSSGGSSSYSITDMSGGGSGGGRAGGIIQSSVPFSGATFNYLTGNWEGPLVQQEVDTQSAQNGVSSSSSNISSRFK